MSLELLKLPIDSASSEILEKLKQHQNLVLTAEPGAGKTTRLPPLLTDHFAGQILVLEPRRIAAVSAADRIATERNWRLGEQVGYQVRFEKKYSASTRVVFLTEKLLTKKILSDQSLKGISIVVFDEFHERSIDTDFALGFLREQQLLGSDIKILVMSATLETAPLSEFLGSAPIVSVPGSLFPTQLHHSKKTQFLRTNDEFYDSLLELMQQAAREGEHDTLVFLPGLGEIDRLHERAQGRAVFKDFIFQKLHGSLKLEEQKKVLRRCDQRRFIFCTNIAESALTVDGVDAVVDCGLEKRIDFDVELGFSSLNLGRVSLFSAQQRAGRSARQYPGKVFQAWTHLDERSMRKENPSSLQSEDLSEILLSLSSVGLTHWPQFTWYENPGEKKLALYKKRLLSLGLIDNNNRLSDIGNKILQWPLDLRASLLLHHCHDRGVAEVGVVAAALLQERDIISSATAADEHFDCDLIDRLHSFIEMRKKQKSFTISQIEKVVGQLAQNFDANERTDSKINIFHKVEQQIENPTLYEAFKLALFNSFRDQLCLRRKDSLKGVRLDRKGVELKNSCAQKSDFFVILSGLKTPSQVDLNVRWASGFTREFVRENLRGSLRQQESLYLDEVQGKIYLTSNEYYFDLEIGQGDRQLASAEAAEKLLPEYISRNWNEVEKKSEALASICSRLRFLEFHEKQPILTEELKLSVAQNISYGSRDLNEIYKKDWAYFISQELSTEIQAQLEKTPEKMEVPSGSWIAVNYEQPASPVLSVRLQEIFGWHDTPLLLAKVPLKIELLGPNFRPVQITSDLRSFWSKTYNEVRKELKIKYPKHSWPEDPWTAKAEAKGRRR